MNIQDLIQKLNIKPIDRVFFQDAQLNFVKFYQAKKYAEIEIQLKQVLPYLLYNQVLNSIKDFIKLDNEVYEKIDDSKDIVIYSKLVKNKEGIVLSEINKEFEGVMKENISKLKNYYSNSEKEKLMEEINNCN